MDISFSGNLLTMPNNKTTQFQYEIRKIEIFDELIIVLLRIPQGTIFNENIYGVDLSTDIRWQIEKIVPSTEDSPYVNIKKSANGLDAFNWSGVKARINLKTGKVAHKRITK